MIKSPLRAGDVAVSRSRRALSLPARALESRHSVAKLRISPALGRQGRGCFSTTYRRSVASIAIRHGLLIGRRGDVGQPIRKRQHGDAATAVLWRGD